MFIARQPIFTRELNVYGYELLFRGDEKSSKFDGTSAMSSTASVLEGLFEAGIKEIVDDKKAFINFDEDFILSDMIELIQPANLVIEVLEHVVIDDMLKERIVALKEMGYSIALDDFDRRYEEHELTQISDIIKYDVIATPLGKIHSDVKKGIKDEKILLAEKIESQEEFELAKKMGFSLFQGFFFSKPVIHTKNLKRASNKLQYIKIIEELKKEEPSYSILAEIIGQDANLSYRIMRIITGRIGGDLVNSIKKALTYMGLKEIERWINVLMIQDLGKEKPDELLRMSLIRAKFAEHIAMKSDYKNLKHEASLMGLFSLLDVLLEETMSEALEDIPISSLISEALVEEKGQLNSIFRLMTAYERGEWEQAENLCASLKFDRNSLYSDYKNSVQWASEVLMNN